MVYKNRFQRWGGKQIVDSSPESSVVLEMEHKGWATSIGLSANRFPTSR